VDRFIQCAVAERDIECTDNARARNVGCGGAARGAALGECGRSHRQRDAECAERRGAASDSVYAEPHAELLGVASNGNGGSGKLHGRGRRDNSYGIVDLAIVAASKLHDVGSSWGDLSIEGVGGDAIVCGNESTSGDPDYGFPELWNYSGGQRG